MTTSRVWHCRRSDVEAPSMECLLCQHRSLQVFHPLITLLVNMMKLLITTGVRTSERFTSAFSGRPSGSPHITAQVPLITDFDHDGLHAWWWWFTWSSSFLTIITILMLTRSPLGGPPLSQVPLVNCTGETPVNHHHQHHYSKITISIIIIIIIIISIIIIIIIIRFPQNAQRSWSVW